jgi:hypothetical protein
LKASIQEGDEERKPATRAGKAGAEKSAASKKPGRKKAASG